MNTFGVILSGTLTLALGQIIIRFFIEPYQSLKKEIGDIAYSLDFYANKMGLDATPEEHRQAKEVFRAHACKLRECLSICPFLFLLPSKEDIEEASLHLIGWSNFNPNSPRVTQGMANKDDQIKELLGISVI